MKPKARGHIAPVLHNIIPMYSIVGRYVIGVLAALFELEPLIKYKY